jgi:DNA-binding MarR family transcriptional regulator
MADVQLEDVLHAAFVELTAHGETYLSDFAASISPGLRRGAAMPLLRLRRTGPLRVKDLACALDLDSTTVTRHLDDLKSRGLVRREPDPADRRAVLVSLTDHAAELLEKAEVERRGNLRDGLSDWSAEDRATFIKLFSRFVQRDDLAAHVTALTNRQDQLA